MDIVEAVLDSSILTFLGVSSIPVFLLLKYNRFVCSDRGYQLIIGGTCVIAVGALLDYGQQVLSNLDMLDLLPEFVRGSKGAILAIVFYFPGTVLVGFGLSKWLPAIQRIDEEISRRRELEEELRKLVVQLNDLAVRAEEANQSKATFLATMNHELRTPLNAIIGFSEIIGSQLLGKIENSRYVQYGELISEGGTQLLAVLSDVLELSKIETGETTLANERISVLSNLRDCIELLAPQARKRNVTIFFETPDPGDDFCVTSDRRQFRQMALNLLSNAIKFSNSGGVVRVSVAVSETWGLSIKFEDSGRGMSEEQILHASEPFARIDSAYARSEGGTGLGLPIVYRLIRLHGGDISISSEIGKGTEVTLTFPTDRIHLP